MANTHGSSSGEVLTRLARESGAKIPETSIVTSPGARAAAWPVKVISHVSYNVYNVYVVELGDPGSLPVGIGSQMQAVNMAESFLDEGQLSSGSYAVMFKVGNKNIFYASV